MLTPLNIMSLDQGREFARQEMKRIYAEPAKATSETRAPGARSEAVLKEGADLQPKWRSLFADFIGLWEAGYPVRARRY
jgi:hypothetical protein